MSKLNKMVVHVKTNNTNYVETFTSERDITKERLDEHYKNEFVEGDTFKMLEDIELPDHEITYNLDSKCYC